MAVDYGALKKGGFMRQKQKNNFSLRLQVVGGTLTAENLKIIAEVAEKYGDGHVHLTSRQGVEIPFIKLDDIDEVKEELAKGVKLYCLGDIVHNGMEVERLHEAGLLTIDHEEMKNLHLVKVLLRAHGEPPQTYALAEKNDIEIIDATCPVVLQLQRRIKKQFVSNPDAQIVIFGKKGHAEVLGLVGQTESHAIVVEKFDEVKQLQEMGKLDFSKDIYLYSQTTKSLDEFHRIIDYCQEHIVDGATFKSFDTICRQVANRMPNIANFASKHDVILFVSGRKSSNGKVLFNECKSVNPNSYQIESADEINMNWVKNVKTVGICGATSTPKWLMEEIMNHLKNTVGQSE